MQPNHQPGLDQSQIETKTSFWSKFGGGALSIAVIIHVALALFGGIWIAQRIYSEPPKVDIFVSMPKGNGEPRVDSTNKPSQNRIALTSKPMPIIAINNPAVFSIPDTSDDISDISSVDVTGDNTFSNSLNGPSSGPNSNSNNFNVPNIGDSNKKMFDMLPNEIRERCSKKDRLARLKQNGGTAECEEAVLKGLRWLKSKQNPDGSWGTANKGAMTGLVLLAYFGHCETPESNEFGQSCLLGIVYLVNTGTKNNGILTTNIASQAAPYEHAIATYALGEAATFCQELNSKLPALLEVTEKAGQLIIDNQNENGGWAYGYSKIKGGHTDSSVVGWQLQALKACSHTSIKYKGMDTAVKNGLAYLSSLQNENGAFGYNSTAPRAGLTGVGVLCFQMWDKGKSKEVRNGVKYIKDNMKLQWNTADSDLYAHYYASQAMMQAGDNNWKSYNRDFRDQLLENQNPDGSWKAPAFTGHGQTAANDIYRNTLCVLMLEVYYRFLSTDGASNRGSSRPGI